MLNGISYDCACNVYGVCIRPMLFATQQQWQQHTCADEEAIMCTYKMYETHIVTKSVGPIRNI